MDKLKNIYQYLEELDYDERCKLVAMTIKKGADPKQAIFSIIQPFYEKILDDLNN